MMSLVQLHIQYKNAIDTSQTFNLGASDKMLGLLTLRSQIQASLDSLGFSWEFLGKDTSVPLSCTGETQERHE